MVRQLRSHIFPPSSPLSQGYGWLHIEDEAWDAFYSRHTTNVINLGEADISVGNHVLLLPVDGLR